MILKLISSILPTRSVFAHCDIPCGIYDPTASQIAANSVIRMNQLLLETEKEPESVLKISKIARLTKVKEEHTDILKKEVRIIWGDYFKEEHLKDFPNLHSLVFEIMHLASKARQTIDMEISKELLAKVQEFAEDFYKSKKATPVRVNLLAPAVGELVTYKI